MTLWKEINDIPCTKEALRKFGLTLGIAFGLIGGFLLWRVPAGQTGGRLLWPYFLGVSCFFFVFGLALPMALKPLQKVWMTLALLMGWVMSRVILIVTFFLIVTPIGLVLRLLGKDLLDIRRGVKKESHWSSRRPRAKEDYENQF